MRSSVLLFLALSLAFGAWSQNCPAEFTPFTTAEYLYCLRGDTKPDGMGRDRFLQQLRQGALGGLAEQVEVRVKSLKSSDVSVVDGATSLSYSSHSLLSSDVTLRLAQTKELFDDRTSEGFVIAYINKPDAVRYYKGDYRVSVGKVRTAMDEAATLVAQGSKARARDEKLKPVQACLDAAAVALSWLNLFGLSRQELDVMVDEYNALRLSFTSMLAELEHGVAVCLRCSANINGEPYPLFASELKGQMERLGCHFVESADEAEWVIDVSASVSRTSHFQNMAYFCWVDGDVRVFNNVTHKVVFENRLSDLESGHPDGIKGEGSTSAFEPSARDAYRQAARIAARKCVGIMLQ